MTDLKLVMDPDTLEADLGMSGAELALEDGLDTAVIISWFTDARADPDDELPGGPGSDPRGFWGDSVAPAVDGDVTGSKLWLLERSKRTPDTINRAQDYGAAALAWMIEDGVADKIEVTAAAFGDSGIALAAAITVDGKTAVYQHLLKGA